MDAIFGAIAKLLGAFTEPVQVVLLLMVILEGVGLYLAWVFFTSNYKSSIENDLRNAQALEGVQRALEKVNANGKP